MDGEPERLHSSGYFNDEVIDIENEFSQIKTLHKTKEISPEAKSESNLGKNRYPDVLPLEATRVKLSKDEQNDSDYINANYVTGQDESSQLYICCQAPLPNTFEDFWRMVWENNSTLIVMLTRTVERSMIKADVYWPDKSEEKTKQYGNILVTLISEKSSTNYLVRREFEITNITNNNNLCKEQNLTREISYKNCVRKIIHLHYTEWPDQGVPQSTQGMMNLIREVDIRKQGPEKPIIVHCSAGIGRSGTFITIHLLAQKYKTSSDKLCVKDTVTHLRQQRFGMVQSKDQYKFVYETLKDIIDEINQQHKTRTKSGKLLNKSDWKSSDFPVIPEKCIISRTVFGSKRSILNQSAPNIGKTLEEEVEDQNEFEFYD